MTRSSQLHKRHGLTALLALIAFMGSSACQVVEAGHELAAISGALPPDMHLPSLSGDATNVVTQLCNWATTEQRPFEPSAIDDLYVRRVTAQDPNVAAWSLLYSFIEAPENPRRLTIFLDPRGVARPRGRERLYDSVEEPGVWTFEKVNLAACDGEPAGFALSRGGQCIRAFAAPGSQTDKTAAYDNVAYRMPDGPLPPRQLVDVQVLTLERENVVTGRSVRVTFFANPLEVGGINHVCEPVVLPVAFESYPQE